MTIFATSKLCALMCGALAGLVVSESSILGDHLSSGTLARDGQSQSDQTLLSVKVRIVQVLDSRGNAGFYDIQKPMSFAVAEGLVAGANLRLRAAGIRLLLSPENFETKYDDYLDLDCDPPSPSANLTDLQRKPVSTGVQEHWKALLRIANEKKDTITVIVHRGSEWKWNQNAGRWELGLGASHGGPGLKPGEIYPLRLVGARAGVLAHEIGHCLGLNHTFRDNGVPGKTEDDVSRVIQDYLDKGGDPNHPELGIDGDYDRGVLDTLPDPGPQYWPMKGIKDQKRTITIRLRGREPFPLTISRDNLMSDDTTSQPFTRDQIQRMRGTLLRWLAALPK